MIVCNQDFCKHWRNGKCRLETKGFNIVITTNNGFLNSPTCGSFEIDKTELKYLKVNISG